MEVSSYNIEFGYELLSAVPYAYELHLKGELTKTISGKGSEPLYYFSPNHEINPAPRSWFNTTEARLKGLPYTFIHRWERPNLTFPPYKEQYANDEFKWEKPTLVIANRYNVEWSKKPVNYFDEKVLDWLFTNLKRHYEIVYIAVDLPKELEDHEAPLPLNDRGLCEKHGIKVFQDIKAECWNTSLLKVFANCHHYITMNGGYSILASLFGGQNIAYSKRDPQVHAKELDFNEFFRYYPNHSNQQVVGVETYEELKSKVQALYIEKLPTANIIVRTAKRPNAFARCYRSIMAQDYPNINIVVTTDEPDGVRYTREAKARHIAMKPLRDQKEPPNAELYGKWFWQNTYIDVVQRLVDGYILILDDDDMFNATNAVSLIMENASPDTLLCWKVKFPNKTIPDHSFGKEVTLYDIASNGFCYHSKHVDKTDWSPWKRADYRTAKRLSEHLNLKWLDATLAKLQGSAGSGLKIDINPQKIGYMKTVKILHPSAGKVGSVKRLDNAIAAKVVEAGLATYIKDVVEELNQVKPRQVIEKPKPAENKVIDNIILTPEDKKTLVSTKQVARTRKPRQTKSTKK